jgi:hypothetical protein
LSIVGDQSTKLAYTIKNPDLPANRNSISQQATLLFKPGRGFGRLDAVGEEHPA